jgi:hypothetical protein
VIPILSSSDNRQYAPATERNRGPILAVLQRVLPETGLLLEIAAGSGQHAAYFAPYFPGLIWQPSEPDPDGRASITAWIEHANSDNLKLPIDLDATIDPWPLSNADAIFSSNMIHIAPWECCLGLMAGAGRILGPLGVLILYGPFMRGGKHTSQSNAQFDNSLKERDPAWGIRDLDTVTKVAKSCGLVCSEVVEMPANNLTVVLKR